MIHSHKISLKYTVYFMGNEISFWRKSAVSAFCQALRRDIFRFKKTTKNQGRAKTRPFVLCKILYPSNLPLCTAKNPLL